MRPKNRMALGCRVISLTVMCLIGVYFVFSAFAYVGAKWEQRNAEKMLSTIRKMRLGVTTQTEYLNQMAAFYEYVPHHPGVPELVVNYSVTNFNDWSSAICQHVPARIGRVLHRCGALLVVIFSVSPGFADGKLVRLDTEEITEGMDGVHPILAAVHDHLQGKGKYEGIGPNESFTGYSSSVRQEEYEDGSGDAVGSPWGLRTDVEMDDRATARERDAAYLFHLECFTQLAGCQDSRLLLGPIPDSASVLNH